MPEVHTPGQMEMSMKDQIEQCYREHTPLQMKYLKQMSFLANRRRAEMRRRKKDQGHAS